MPSLPQPAELYEQDVYAWTQLQARELRRLAATRPNSALDLPHFAEEIADLGKEQRDSLRSWVTRVVEHLLALEHSPATDPRRGWIGEVVDLRDEIDARLTRALRRDLERQLPHLYRGAARRLGNQLRAQGKTGAAEALPSECPYSLEQVLGDWWPPDGADPGRRS
jgi:hypothetical protein